MTKTQAITNARNFVATWFDPEYMDSDALPTIHDSGRITFDGFSYCFFSPNWDTDFPVMSERNFEALSESLGAGFALELESGCIAHIIEV